MTKIFAPNKQYSGVSAGVRFVEGQGETTDARSIEWFKEKGYGIDAPLGKPAAPDASDESGEGKGPVHTKESLEALKRDELVTLAKTFEIESPQKTKSEELVAAILDKVAEVK